MSGQMSEPPSGFAPPLYECSDPNLDIIAVHGIGAHRDKTWSHDGVNWLGARDMLPHDFPRARIMAYGYASNWLGKKSMSTSLDAVAGRLLSLVHELRNECPERNVIFIAHCFGGIVIEKAILKALVNDSDQDRSLLAHISGIVLLGTPHRGSASAGLANIVAAIAAFFEYGQRSLVLETVRNDSQMLADTVREFARKAYHLNFRIHCFYEEIETDIAAVIRPLVRPFINVTSKTMLVDRDSACLQGHGETALTLDHFKLNKFTNPADANYILVRRALLQIDRATEPPVDQLVIKCMEDLYIGDPEYQIRSIEDKWGEVLPQCYRWITEDRRFQDWQNSDHRRVLWISGGTRVDKAMLMVGIAREFSPSRGPLAYFFCESGDSNNSACVFRSLIWGLVYICPPLGQYLKKYASPGKRFSEDVLNPRILYSLLSIMLRDATIPTVYLLVDAVEECSIEQDLLLRLIKETASDPSSKAKWIVSSRPVDESLTHASWLIELQLKDSTISSVLQTFKACTMNDMVEDATYCYRIRGFPPACTAQQAQEILHTILSAEEQGTFNPKIRMIPTCDDSGDRLTALMTTDLAPQFLCDLDYDPLGDCRLDTIAGQLIFDRHFYGFTQLYANPQSEPINADVIAIAGLTGHAYASWRGQKPLRQMWLQDFLAEDLPRCRILTYGYNSDFSTRGIKALQYYCTQFLVELKKVRRTAEEVLRPLILIGHGFGSIIVAQILIQAKESEGDTDPIVEALYDTIKAMVFFATPDRGMLIDNIQSMIAGDATNPNPNLIEGINDGLQRLTDNLCNFKNFIRDRRVINIVATQQRESLTGVLEGVSSWSKSKKFIEPESAILDLPDNIGNRIRVSADPSSIAKFNKVFDSTYLRTVKFLREFEEAAVKKRSLEWINAATVRSYGLTIMHDPQEAIADIVLIPGLAGDPWETWSPSLRSRTHFATLGRFWPASFLPKDCPGVRILVWGFEPDSRTQMGAFLDKASELLRALVSSRPLGRSMVFVAHSLGGILLKETLRLADKGESMATKDIMSYTSAVVFLGTPHRGDGDALSFSDVVQRAVLRCATGAVGQELLSGGIDVGLEACRESFLAQWKAYDFRVKCFAENTAPAFLPPGQEARYVVPIPAATLEGLHQVESMSASPMGFCRFQDESDRGYRQIARELQVSLDQIKRRELHLKEDCLKSLYFDQLQSRELDITTALESTATWLFKHTDYIDWARWDVPQSKQRLGLLWVRGKPGSGKSTLMKEGLRRAKIVGLKSSFSVAGFFFAVRSNIRLQKSPLGLFRTLLHDLIQQDTALLSAFITVYKRKCAANPGSWEWHQDELQNFFKSAYLGEFPRVRNAVVYIDALDESDKKGDNEAYQVAHDLVYYFRDITAGEKLKVCLSSRHYPEFDVLDCPRIATEKFNGDDIVHFVTTKLSGANHDARAKRLVKKIADKAKGVFLWVILVVGTLNRKLVNRMRDKDLDETLNSLPAPLDDLFKSLFADTSEESELQMAATIFQWILLAQRPLEKDELRHALIIDREKIEAPEDTGIWNLSRDCLPGDPEEFLGSLRFYTRGLAEVILRWEERQRKRPRRRIVYSSKRAARSPLPPPPPPDKDEDEDEDERPRMPRLVAALAERERKYLESNSKEIPIPNFSTTPLSGVLGTHRDLAPMPTVAKPPLTIFARTLPTTEKLGYLQIPYNPYRPTPAHASSVPLLPSLPIYSIPYAKEYDDGLRGHSISDTEESDDAPTKFVAGYSPVQFIHESVREFFLRRQGFLILESDQHHKSFPERHEILAEYCMACIYQNGSSTRDSCSAEGLMRTYPFLRYATQSLFYHVYQAECGGRILERAIQGLAAADQRLWKSWIALDLSLPNGGEKFCEKVPGFAPLHLLCRKGMLLSASALLKLRANINVQDHRGNSPLHYAVSDAAVKVVQFLVKNQANIRIQNCKGETPLHRAVQCRASESVLTGLLQPFLEEKPCLDDTDLEGYMPLHTAVLYGNAIAVQILLSHGAQVNSRTGAGCTALHLALEGDHPKIVAKLLASAADPNTLNQWGEAPIHLAATKPNVSLLRILISYGARVNTRDSRGLTPIHLRIKQFLGIRALIASGADIEARTTDGRTPLHSVVLAEGLFAENLMALIDAGADRSATDGLGKTALHYAAKRSPATLQLLLQANDTGMELSKPDIYGRTPLHYAAQRDDLRAFRLLVDAGADLTVGDRSGVTPVDYVGDKITSDRYLRHLLESKGYKRTLRHIKGRMTAVFAAPEGLH